MCWLVICLPNLLLFQALFHAVSWVEWTWGTQNSYRTTPVLRLTGLYSIFIYFDCNTILHPLLQLSSMRRCWALSEKYTFGERGLGSIGDLSYVSVGLTSRVALQFSEAYIHSDHQSICLKIKSKSSTKKNFRRIPSGLLGWTSVTF